MTGALLDIDPSAADSFGHLAAHLSGPLAGGALQDRLAIESSGRITLAAGRREPALFLALASALGGERLTVRATLDPDGAATPLVPLAFHPWTERGAFLPLHRPSSDPTTRTAGEVVVAFTAERNGVAVAAADLAALFELRVIEGIMGRLIYLLTAETARVRRAGREIAAMRRLDQARGGALDRIGADLAVPRFAEALSFSEADGIVSRTEREPDPDYRQRLGLYRSWLAPTPAAAARLLAGEPGLPAGLQAMGLAGGFRLREDDNPISATVHLVSVAAGEDEAAAEAAAEAQRQNLLAFLRAAVMIAPGVAAPASPFVAWWRRRGDREGEPTLAERLAAAVDFSEPEPALAPGLALALDRAGATIGALGLGFRLRVRRTQDTGGGSRHALGLGLVLDRVTDTRRQSLATAVAAADLASLPERARGVVATLRPAPEDDPDAAWFFHACGFRTVHRISAQRLYLSHLGTNGLVVTGPEQASVGRAASGLELQAQLFPPSDAALNLVLSEALRREGGEGARWTVLARNDATALWNTLEAPSAEIVTRLAAARLAAVETPGQFAETLPSVPAELLATLELPAPVAQTVLAGEDAAWQRLGELVRSFAGFGVASAAPVFSAGGRVGLILSAIGLPLIGANLTGRRAVGFRWYTVPISGSRGSVSAHGSRARFQASAPGLTAVVVLTYARLGATDPFEVRVEPDPPDLVMDHRQYEYLMNLLTRLCPTGVEINTYAVRQGNVRFDGDGPAVPLPPGAARTFRPYRRPRLAGLSSVTLDS